jgi:hypothetical protein
LQRIDVDPEKLRELSLRQAMPIANAGDGVGIKLPPPEDMNVHSRQISRKSRDVCSFGNLADCDSNFSKSVDQSMASTQCQSSRPQTLDHVDRPIEWPLKPQDEWYHCAGKRGWRVGVPDRPQTCESRP